MKQLTRHVEIPRTNTAKELKSRYPGYVIWGDSHGYHWPVVETKTVIVSYGFKTLIEAIKAHMVANDIAIPAELERRIHEFECAEHVENCEDVDPMAERKITLWYLAKKFFTAAISAAVNGLVSQEEAEIRASICSTCPNNGGSSIQFCNGCHTARFVKEAAEALSTKSTPIDNQLNTCSLCECNLRMKIWVQKDAMQDKDIEWPSFCWMRPEN